VLNVPLAQKSFWTHSKEQLGDPGHVESHFGLHGDSVSVSARWVLSLRRAYHVLENHFGHTQ
jgi:hypothetical protein